MSKSVYYYSERGMINCLVNWLIKDDDNCKNLLNKIIYADLEEKTFDQIDEIEIFNEFSFGEFGDPDLIIKVKTEGIDYYFIIEAKLTTFKSSASKFNEKIKYIGHASDIDIQLLLRKRFIEIAKKFTYSKEEYISEVEEYRGKGERALKKDELLIWTNDTFRNSENHFYIALTTDEPVPTSDVSNKAKEIYEKWFNSNRLSGSIKTIIDKKEFGLLSWKSLIDIDNGADIPGFAATSKLINTTFRKIFPEKNKKGGRDKC